MTLSMYVALIQECVKLGDFGLSKEPMQYGAEQKLQTCEKNTGTRNKMTLTVGCTSNLANQWDGPET